MFPGEADFFCGGHAFLADGRILVVGGGCRAEFHNKVMTFSLDSGPNDPWEVVEPMNHVRWYPTLTTLPDGRILATSGQDEQILPELVTLPEVYDPETNTWTTLSGAERSLDLYPLMFVAPDGRVFHAGRSHSSDAFHAFLDVDTQTWSGFIPALQWGDHSSAVMYAPGKILKAGGEVGGDESKMIDLNEASPFWGGTILMNVAREDLDLIVLPNGFVLAVGGNTSDLRAEWINPNAPLPSWIELAETNVAREYHSTTLLLPDARVLAAGGGFDDAEVFSPPYLFTGTPRPEIECAPDQIHYGANFYIDIDEEADVAPGNIDAVNLVRFGAITHGFDQNTRFVPLTDDPTVDGNRLYVPAPVNANIAPPGHYMLFLISDAGVPSVAAIVQVTPCPEGCPGDLNDDNRVDVFDLLDLLGCWGEVTEPSCEGADLDENGSVEVFDLLALLAAWGSCDCDTECPPETLNDCWNRYQGDTGRYEACVEWVAERETYYPTDQ